MIADAFDALWSHFVVERSLAVGFERWGTRIWFEDHGLRVAVVRTELRHDWPFELTLVVGHSCLRDVKDRLPAPRSGDPKEYPIKIEPSRVATLANHFRYTPYNLGRYPNDRMHDATAAGQLEQIGAALAEYVPTLAQHLTPQTMLDAIRRDGENAWCEQRWIADYKTEIDHAESDR